MDDLSDHPFAIHMATEAYESPGEKAWLRWVKKVEGLLGHDLDGNQYRDGYSLDFAYGCWEAGDSPETYVAEVQASKAALLAGRAS